MDIDFFRDASQEAPGISLATVGHDDDHANANALVARRYSARGYTSTRLSTRNEEALTVCTARQGERIVGTVAVRFDSASGFNADATFFDDMQELRATGLRICEFSRLAVDEDAADNKRVLARLFHLAYLHGHRLGACDLLVIEVNPRHVSFYRRLLGFTVLSGPRLNARVNAPSVLLMMDMRRGAEWVAMYGGNPALAASTRMLYPYFYSASEEAEVLAKLRQ
ncbi:MAG TPA: long-chain N-acyl amino acid synthase [Burkholderiaceae bacterium]|jgi:hypothetical protein